MRAAIGLAVLALNMGCASAPHGDRVVLNAARARLGEPAADGPGFVAETLVKTGRIAVQDGLPDAGQLHAVAVVNRMIEARPSPGAVMFFADGPRAFHAGIVDEVGDRIRFLHATRGRVRRGVCDPRHPTERRDGRGLVANSYVRTRGRYDPPRTRYLCGELIADYAVYR